MCVGLYVQLVYILSFTNANLVVNLFQHFWVAISMVFFVAATMFTLLKLSGNSLLTREMLNLDDDIHTL